MNIEDVRHLIEKVKSQRDSAIELKKFTDRQALFERNEQISEKRLILQLRSDGKTLAQIAAETKRSIKYVTKHVPQFIRIGNRRGSYNIKPRSQAAWPFINNSSDRHPLIEAIDAAVPRGLRENVRQDICQNIAVAILLGEVHLDSLRDVVERFIRPQMREANDRSVLSLDYPTRSTHNTPLKAFI